MTASTNPLLESWTTPFGLPPLEHIRPEHFAPAFEKAFADHRAEIDAIASHPQPATFANTIDALERSGRLLERVGATFWNLAGANTTPELQAVERDIAPKVARHATEIGMHEGLFRRIDDLAARAGDLGLTLEQARVLDLTHKRFVRAGARLTGADRARMAEIMERLAVLGTRFSQNVLADEASWEMVLEGEEDLAGLPGWLREAAARAAADRGRPGKHLVTLSRSSIEPFLQLSANRARREEAFQAWIRRGENGGDTDNRTVASEMLALRAERARLLGFPTFAAFKLDTTMAKTPEAVRDLLDRVWLLAREQATAEHRALEALAREEGSNEPVAAHDWRFWSARLRRKLHDLDEAVLKPYFQLEKMIEAAFDTATQLFGVTFTPVHGLALYHPDVRAWEVKDREGRHVALFLGDYFARPSKRSGAWMSAFRGQQKLAGDIRPIVVNVMNFAQAEDGRPTLLSLDDARTLFHEFGHALHGMLSDVIYPSIAGTSVARDFVEFPSQIYEHWLMRPEVLSRFAVHAETGEPLPGELVQRVLAARNFNQGFATVEYVSSAVVDLDFHTLEDASNVDVAAFERDVLARLGMPAAMVMRHRPPHFSHVFSGDGYSAGYYSYLWSEVLDADGFAAFEEAGDVFDAGLAKRLRDHVYSAGASRDPVEAYRAFRGRDPDPSALLRKRGFLGGLGEALTEEA